MDNIGNLKLWGFRCSATASAMHCQGRECRFLLHKIYTLHLSNKAFKRTSEVSTFIYTDIDWEQFLWIPLVFIDWFANPDSLPQFVEQFNLFKNNAIFTCKPIKLKSNICLWIRFRFDADVQQNGIEPDPGWKGTSIGNIQMWNIYLHLATKFHIHFSNKTAVYLNKVVVSKYETCFCI